MHRLRPSLLLAALVVATGTRADPPAAPATPPATTTAGLVDGDVASVLAASRQLVVVQTSSWDDRVGRLQRFERHGTDKGGGWRAVGEGIDIVVGTAGLGWGIGLHGGGDGVNAPRKVEGDGRAPAGVFRLTRAFGKQAAPESGLPSRTLTPGDVCVDDVSHAAYNRILPAGTEKTWKSAEQLVRKDWLYDLIVVVDQNHGESDGDRVVAGRGSCVFLHVWRREKSGTAGCTAMDKAHLEDVIRWLKADDAPLLVQLPRDVYASVRATWGLP